MSKLSFRARQLDVYKTMPIYRSEEIPEVTDVAAINRAVPQMPTGMEKEEETEHHLQRALSAQQVYGTSQALVIPIPGIDDAKKQYDQIYPTDYKPPKQYIHAQTYGVDQEIPDYDIDSEDEAWLESQSKKMEITPKVFEEMIDRLEKGSGQQVVELKDAKVLLKEDDDLIITVYDYWLNKRLKYTVPSLIPTVKSEKRDGSTTNNPYVAFRRRTEKMQTRKNRKNDEVSYEKMLKLRRDLQRAVTVLEMIKKREKCKKELLQLTIDIIDKRYEMDDFTGSHLMYAEAQKVVRSAFYPLYNEQNASKDPSEASTRKMKRKYEKKKHKSGASQIHGDVDILEYVSNEDEPLSPGISLSDQEDDIHPDGPYAFRRKRNCCYHAPLDSCGSWSWNPQRNMGRADKRYRYSLTSINTCSESRRCIGFARQRRGRGGRIILDRAYLEQRSGFWDDVLNARVPSNSLSSVTKQTEPIDHFTTKKEDNSFDTPTFHDFLSENKWLHFTPSDDHECVNSLFNGALLDVSSDDISDVIDPIIDIVPEPANSSLPAGFVPIVTAPSIAACDQLSQLLPTLHTDNDIHVIPSHCDTRHATPTTPSTNKQTLEYAYEPHYKQLETLKQDQHSSNNRLSNVPSAQHITANKCQNTGNEVLDESVTSSSSFLASSKVTYAVSTLVNGPAIVRGNGIKHLNGPSKELKQGEVHSSGAVMVKGIRKLNYPLTPSSDTSDTPTSIGSDLITIASIPGESGDNMSCTTRLSGETDFTDSAGLNSIADVASTMEVT